MKLKIFFIFCLLFLSSNAVLATPGYEYLLRGGTLLGLLGMIAVILLIIGLPPLLNSFINKLSKDKDEK